MLSIIATTLVIAGQQPVTIEQELAWVAANTIVPEQIDDISTLTSVRANGRILTYVYRIEQKEGTAAELREFFITQKMPILCQDENTIRQHRLGATIRYHWISGDDREPVTVDVSGATCRGLR